MLYVNMQGCVYVCMGVCFIIYLGMELKLGMGVGDGLTRFESIFFEAT